MRFPRTPRLPILCIAAVLAGCVPPRLETILFQALPPDDSEDIYSLDFRTGEVQRITQGQPAYANSFPARSPDGDHIAFVRESNRSALFVLSTRRGLRLLPTPDVPVLGPPAWSPDGAEILIAAGEDSQRRRLYRVKADGSGFAEIPLGPGMYDCGTYSPEGDRIVATMMNADQSAVVVFNTEGKTIETLASSDSLHYHCPEWSPRGKWVGISVYSKDYRRGSIAMIDLADHALHVLPAGLGYNNAFKWSPDGTWILYQCTDFSGTPEDRGFYRSMEICAIRPDGTDRRRLTRNQYFDAHPSW